MSVDYQEDYEQDWDMADMVPEIVSDMDAEDGNTAYSSLNEAMDEAGSVIGDMSANLPIAFRFTWQKLPIFCRIVARESQVYLELDTDLGPLPFTIENIARRRHLKQLHNFRKDLPVGEYVLTERGRFRHRVERLLEAPITGGSIVTSVVQSILAGRPYFELAKTTI